jgi:acetyl-CoA carboxylase, biotin carboxylase subunit
MEMNARIQLEHAVSGMVTGVDRSGSRSASPPAIGYLSGSRTCRSMATRSSDPDRNFAPAAGRLDVCVPRGGPWPGVDSHCYPGFTITPFYDSLLAKLIVWGPDRISALDRLRRALGEFAVQGRGIKTTIGFHQRVLADEQFRRGDVSTDYVAPLAARDAMAGAASG